MRLLLIIPLTALLVGCGSDSKTETSGPAPAASTSTATPAPSGGSSASNKPQTVEIAEFKFGEPVTVAIGTKVTWKNLDDAPHNAVGDKFKTADLEKGESDTVTFDEPGTYDYICTFHPYMKGSVVVE